MQSMQNVRPNSLDNLRGQSGIIMKQGWVNQCKKWGRNREEKQCINLTSIASARTQGLPIPGGTDCPCQGTWPCVILFMCEISRTECSLQNLLRRVLFKAPYPICIRI